MSKATLTRDMLYERDAAWQTANADALASSNVNLWLPFTETGTVTPVSDVANATPLTFADAGAAQDKRDAIKIGFAANPPTSGTMPAPYNQFCFIQCLEVVSSAAFFAASYGTSAAGKDAIVLADGTASINFNSTAKTTASSASSAPVGATYTAAAILHGTTLYHYRSLNRAGMTLVNSIDATAAIAAMASAPVLTINQNMAFSSIAVRQQMYGLALLSWASPPSLASIVSACDEMENNWLNGIKKIPAALL